MSFQVNWNTLEPDSLREWTSQLLTDALNSGKRPPILASDIQIKDLNFGKVAPDFEILDIGELDLDRFRGIFKINYSGDFHLTLHTRVQANPLTIYQENSNASDAAFVTPNFLLASDPFALPLDLKLSDIRILGIGIIVFLRSKGLTLVFRNDPLDSIKVTSTFDTVQVLAKFLQNQIETQIRDLFRETLPTLIHRLSLKYLSSDDSSFLDDLRPQLAALHEETVSLMDIDPDVPYSPENLSRVLALFKSRETLRLAVPKIRHSVQRCRLEKFTKTQPSLVRCLHDNLNLDLVAAPQHTNEIPVELVSGADFSKTNHVLREISSIQASNYYRSSSSRPKRRVIKLGSKKSLVKSTPLAETLASPIPSEMSSATASEHVSPTKYYQNDSHISLYHPKPRQADGAAALQLANPQSYLYHNVSSTPQLPSNSSLLAGIGLGNNYFNFASQSQISTSPIRRSSQELEDKKVTGKKSINHLDIAQLNSKLNATLHTIPDVKLHPGTGRKLDTGFEMPPPPPYQV